MLILNFLLKNVKDVCIYMLSWYLFNKIAVGLNNGFDTASEPGAGTPDLVPVYCGEYLSDGGHQAGLDTIWMSIDMYLKFAPA